MTGIALQSDGLLTVPAHRRSRPVWGVALGCLFLAAGVLGAAAQTPAPPAPDAAATAAPPAEPSPAEPPPPLYEARMLRLSEILGGLYFLENLCGNADAVGWRDQMAALLDAEQPGPARRQRLVSRFNYGFETWRAGYRVCTPAAKRATELYMAEGRRLVADLRARFAE